MKRYLVPLVVLTIGLFAYVYGGVATFVRHAGTSTDNMQMFYLVQDSSDTFSVDTTYSDTVTIDQTAEYLGYYLIRDTIVLSDSANDSVIVNVNLWTQADAGFARKLKSETFTADLTRDSITGQFFINKNTWQVDSLVLDKIWFETVVSDSVIQDKGIDTTKLTLRYFVVQK